MLEIIIMSFIITILTLLMENFKLKTKLGRYEQTESDIYKRINADKLIDGIKAHFNIYNILKEIPFVAWWIKDSNSNLIECSNNLKSVINELSEDELIKFKANCKISDQYILKNYNVDGTRRAMAFYEVLDLHGKGKVWKVIKICIPVNENNNKKVNIFSIAIMHEKLHGCFEKARLRLQTLEDLNMVIKINDNMFINRSKGDY